MSIAEAAQGACQGASSRSPHRGTLPGQRIDRRLQVAASLVVDGGCDVWLRGDRLADVARVALLEWLQLAEKDLVAYEGGLYRETPQLALAELVRPPTIWAAGEALFAARLACAAQGSGRWQRDVLGEYAATQIGERHLRRLRRVAARFSGQLPIEALPRASATVATGCAAVASDDEACAAVAATQLARYAASAFVARRRMEAAPTMT